MVCLVAAEAQAQLEAGQRYRLEQGGECVAATAAGSPVALAPCEAAAATSDQTFTLVASSGGTFTVQSNVGGEVLDIDGGSSAAGATLITWPANGQANQRFAIASRGGALYDLRPQHAPSMCLAAQADGSIRLASCSAGEAAQSFELVEVEGPPAGTTRDCTAEELYRPWFVENLQGGPMGANAVILTGGYMMVLFARDSGVAPGILHFYDISNPRSATLVKRIDDEHTARFREAHSLPIARIGTSEYVAIQTIDGIQFWDLSDPLDARYVSQIDLPGVTGGDYENVAWQAEWQGSKLYVAGANQGIYVVDAHDPHNPELITQVPTGRTGGFRVGPLLARGSYLVIGNMDQAGAYSVLDVSQPALPSLLGTLDQLPRLYSMTATGDRIYGAGRDGDFTIHSFADPTSISEVSTTRIGQDSLYVAAQDNFVFSGRQENFVKLDVSDEQDVQIVGEGTVGRGNSDHGQVTPMGNWLFVGNDHGTGSALFCHAPTDDLPLIAQAIFPADESTHQDPGTAITIVFSDYVDTTTIGSSTVMVRASGGEALDGIYTYNFNTLAFSPDRPFEPDTTYEIAMPAGGVKDVSGNPLAEDVLVRFSTGSSIVVAPPPDEETGGSGGAAGAAGSSGSAGGLAGASGGVGGAGGEGGNDAVPPAMIDGGMSPAPMDADAGAAPSGPAQERAAGGCSVAVRARLDRRAWLSMLLVAAAVGARRMRRPRRV